MPSSPRRPSTIYASGQRYRFFTLVNRVYDYVTRHGRTVPAWRCLCDCGKGFVTPSIQITKGIRNSCGCRNQSQPVTDKDAVSKARFSHYRNGAKSRDLPWLLTYDQFVSILFDDCVYCGSPPGLSVTVDKHTYLVNGIDRVDNAKGYEPSNVVCCCWSCNAAKSSGTIDEFKAWTNRLISHHARTH